MSRLNLKVGDTVKVMPAHYREGELCRIVDVFMWSNGWKEGDYSGYRGVTIEYSDGFRTSALESPYSLCKMTYRSIDDEWIPSE